MVSTYTDKSNDMRMGRGGSHQRIGHIDALKGFATLLVVLGHIASGYLNAGMFPENERLLRAVYCCIYSCHMPLFFIISGYLYHYAYFDGEKPQKKKIFSQTLNQIFVYVLFSIGFGLFKIVCSQYTNGETSFHDILLIGVKSIFPYWYLYVLIIYYVVFSIPAFSRKKMMPFMLFGTIGLCIGSYFVPEKTWFELRYVMYYLPFFYLGSLCSRGIDILADIKVTIPIFLAAVAIFVSIWWANAGKIQHIIPGDNVIVALGFSIMLWYLFKNVSFLGNCRLFQLCGKYAMEIYVIHCVFTAGNRVVLPRLGITNIYLNIACNVLISTSVPVLFAVMCRKMGIHDLLFKPTRYFKRYLN